MACLARGEYKTRNAQVTCNKCGKYKLRAYVFILPDLDNILELCEECAKEVAKILETTGE